MPVVLVSKVLLVTAVAVPLLYLLHSLAARRLIRLDAYSLLLHMSGAFLVMAIMEASLGHLHTDLFGWRLWEYRLLPNHHGYGSDLGPITWPWYGFHVYLLNQVLAHRRVRVDAVVWKGGMTGLDGPLLETLGNGLFLLFFHQYVFYYFPSDLGHLTSLLVVPYYALAGVVLALMLRALSQARKDWSLPAVLYVIGVCFVVAG